MVLPVGASGKLRVRLLDHSLDLGEYRHCPTMTLEAFMWTIDDPSVARLDGRRELDGRTEEMTITALEVGRTTIRLRYDDYVRRDGGRLQWSVTPEVVEATDSVAMPTRYSPGQRPLLSEGYNIELSGIEAGRNQVIDRAVCGRHAADASPMAIRRWIPPGGGAR